MKKIIGKLLITIILGIVILISGCSELNTTSPKGNNPILSIEPYEYDFGLININNLSLYKEFYLYEDGQDDIDYKDLDIKSIIISDNVNFILDTSNTDKKDVDKTSFKLIFNPKSRGIFNAIIKVKTNNEHRKNEVIVTGRVPEEITVINSNIKHYVDSDNSIILSWDKAVDDIDNQSQLQYLVVYSTTADKMDTVANIESKISEGNATVYNTWYTDINTIGIIGIIPGLEYYFNIIAKDTTGNKIAYNPISFTYIYLTTLQITSFKIETSLNVGAGITSDCIGSIDSNILSVYINVPETTDLTNLIATFTTNCQTVEVGSVVQTSGVTVNDFTEKFYYKITATDGSQAIYSVNVSKK